MVHFLLVFTNVHLLSQDQKFQKVQIGAQINHTFLLSKNAIFSDYNYRITDDYLSHSIDNQLPDGLSYYDLDNSKTLGSVFVNYNFDNKNLIQFQVALSYRYNMFRIDEKTTARTNNTDFGDPEFNVIYYRSIQLGDRMKLKFGLGGGAVINSIDELNSIYSLNRFSLGAYNGLNAYYYKSADHVITTKSLYRTDIDFIITPRIQFDFYRKNKSEFSFVLGSDIMPYSYMGIKTSIFNLNSNKEINSLTTHFRNTTFFIGLSYSLGLGSKISNAKKEEWFKD